MLFFLKLDSIAKISSIESYRTLNLVLFIRHEQYHFFYSNTNTQYFQRGPNNTQYQYQFFEEALTIPNTNTNIHEGS